MKTPLAVLVVAALAHGCGNGGPDAGTAAEVTSYAAKVARRDAEREAPGFTPEEKAIIDRAKADLLAAMPDPGIKVGATAPDFTLPNAFGQPVNLGVQLARGPVVLVFYRGSWCPYCNMHLRSLTESLPEIERLGASVIAITPQTPDRSASQIEEEGYPFEVLSDLDASVMRAYRLYFEVDPDLEALYRGRGLDLADYNGSGRNGLPVPGTFVIDPDGTVRAMQADTDYKARMEPADIVAALAAR